jgi:hypothetical protein
MPVYPIIRPGVRRHDELEDLAIDEILRGGGNLAAGAVATRPAFGRPAGEDRFFYATDEDKLYRDTGGAWQEIVQRASAIGANPIASVYRSTAQSVLNASTTAVSFDTERFDDANLWTPSQPTALGVSKAGRWLFVGGVAYAASALGYRLVAIRKNTGIVSGFQQQAAHAAAWYGSTAAIFNMTPGQYVELLTEQTSGGALNTVAASATNDATWLAAFFLGVAA